MQKVLPGASREALGFIANHWKSLAQMSVLPALAYMIVNYVQISSLSGLYRQMGVMVGSQTVDPAFFRNYMMTMGLSFLFSLVAGALMSGLFVLIIRFQKTGQSQWLLTDAAGWKAAGMVFVYALGIMMLTMVAYMVVATAVVIVAVIVGVILAMALGEASAAVVGILIGVVAAIAIISALFWFMFRFLAGLPGVALGHSPDFFKDLWPLAKGESWGLPLRFLLATMVFYIPAGIIIALALWPVIQDMINSPAFQSGGDNTAIVFPYLADMMERMMPWGIVLILLYMPFVWFISLLLGTAFQRFRGRQAV
jgi:hypothetical protein